MRCLGDACPGLLIAYVCAILQNLTVFGKVQRAGEVVIRITDNVPQNSIRSLIQTSIGSGTLFYTDEYAIYNTLPCWSYEQNGQSRQGEFVRNEDDDRVYEVHVNTTEGFQSLLRSWVRIGEFPKEIPPSIRYCKHFT